MLIHDPAAFSLVVPTFNGTPFLTRTLDYLASVGFKGQIALSDNSAPEHRVFVAACPARYRDLAIKTFFYPESVRFLDKLGDTLKLLPARCVMLHAHDDFFVPEGVEGCIEILETRPDCAAARGRIAEFEVARGPDNQNRVTLGVHTMRAYEQSDPVERVLAHIAYYASTFYSVHRRTNLIEAYSYTEKHTKNVVFFQYLASAIAAAQGKIHCSDLLFYVRQNHAKSWSGKLFQGDYEHWPMLIASPHYSQYYGEFREALCTFIARLLGIDLQGFGNHLDAAYTRLIHRVVCGMEQEGQDEASFRQRVADEHSPEHERVKGIVDFCLRYPDTY